ncbi:MAG: hypothetical protein U9R56_02715, partial [candidate division Zixibacteria bacterium]|nr:hypothetical protein [candidate division Zixibacteria bacterium]
MPESGKLTPPHAFGDGTCQHHRVTETMLSSEQHNKHLFADRAKGNASVQPVSENQSGQPRKAVLEDELDSRIMLARKLIKRKDYLGASAILETVYADHPDNTVIYNLLKYCYRELQYFPKWEELARRMVDRHPNDYRFQLDLAIALVKQEKLSESIRAFRQAVALAPVGTQRREVIESMVSTGFETEALTIIDSLSVQIPGSTANNILRGKILEKQKLYGEAAGEYYSALDDTTGDGITAEKKLLDLLGFEESSETAERVLLAEVE